MKRLKHAALAALLIMTTAPLWSAQAQTPNLTTVNLTAEPERVHIAAHSDVTELCLETIKDLSKIVFPLSC